MVEPIQAVNRLFDNTTIVQTSYLDIVQHVQLLQLTIMTDYIPLRQYSAGQDPEAEEADDRIAPPPRRRRRPTLGRYPGLIACGVVVLFITYLGLSRSATGDEQRIPSRGGRGLLEVRLSTTGKTIRRRHPINELIEKAEQKAIKIQELKESIKTLDDAVANYQDTFGLDPPEGFDKWSVHAQLQFDPVRPILMMITGSLQVQICNIHIIHKRPLVDP